MECRERWYELQDCQRPWSQADDQRLLLLVEENGKDAMARIAATEVTDRTLEQCFRRWSYLRLPSTPEPGPEADAHAAAAALAAVSASPAKHTPGKKRGRPARAACATVPLASLSVSEFRHRFLLPCRPVVLGEVTEGWRAAQEWVTPSGAPDLRALAALFGDSLVPVVDCAYKAAGGTVGANAVESAGGGVGGGGEGRGGVGGGGGDGGVGEGGEGGVAGQSALPTIAAAPGESGTAGGGVGGDGGGGKGDGGGVAGGGGGGERAGGRGVHGGVYSGANTGGGNAATAASGTGTEGGVSLMPLRDFAEWWTGERSGSRLLQLRGWRFAEEQPAYHAYEAPPHLCDDWLSEQWEAALAVQADGGDAGGEGDGGGNGGGGEGGGEGSGGDGGGGEGGGGEGGGEGSTAGLGASDAQVGGGALPVRARPRSTP